MTSRSISSNDAVGGSKINGRCNWSATALASCPNASTDEATTVTAATPSLCRLRSRWGSVSSSRRNCDRPSSASSPPRTLSNAGRRARIRQAHVTRRSNPPAPATRCASRETSSVRMLRTEADEIGGGEVLLIAHMLCEGEARRLASRCGRGYSSAWLLRLSFVLLFVLLRLDAMFAPGYFFRLVHEWFSNQDSIFIPRPRCRFRDQSRSYRRPHHRRRSIHPRYSARPRPRGRSAANCPSCRLATCRHHPGMGS